MRLSVTILQVKIAIDIGVAPYIRVQTWRIRRLPNLSIYSNLETWKISTARARRSQRIEDISSQVTGQNHADLYLCTRYTAKPLLGASAVTNHFRCSLRAHLGYGGRSVLHLPDREEH